MSHFEEDPIGESEEIVANGCLKPLLLAGLIAVVVAATVGGVIAYFIFGR